jgi:hypothetical protein
MNTEQLTGKRWNGKAYSSLPHRPTAYTDVDRLIDERAFKTNKEKQDRQSTEKTQTLKNYR